MPYSAESEHNRASTGAPAGDKSLPPTFAQLGVAAEITDALAQRGIVRPFSIQELTLPRALAGRDIIGQARTGMGKTFGFGVPLLDRVFDDADIDELDGAPRALVIVPTRELAVQVGDDLAYAASETPVRVTTIYGGRPYEDQIAALEAGVDVVVGTPGRLIDLHERGDLTLSTVAILVLDEADEMLDMGFLPDIEKLWAAVRDDAQTMLFSATMPGPILSLARAKMNTPVHIRAESADAPRTHDTTRQVALKSHRMDKPEVVARILQARGRGPGGCARPLRACPCGGTSAPPGGWCRGCAGRRRTRRGCAPACSSSRAQAKESDPAWWRKTASSARHRAPPPKVSQCRARSPCPASRPPRRAPESPRWIV